MKFEEKLIMLREKNGLSQDGLAEKLDVTGQMVLNWELGQSKPDMDKLMQMSKLFNISIDMLTDEEVMIDEKTGGKMEEKIALDKPMKANNNVHNKTVLYILIVILITSLVTLAYRLLNSYNEFTNDQNDEWEKEIFNGDFEFYQGTKTDSSVRIQIDKVITNNNKNSNHLIEVVFDGDSYGTEPDDIRTIKNSLRTWNNHEFQYYEIVLYCDDNGYVNKITIDTV